jgi:hypothetical protein
VSKQNLLRGAYAVATLATLAMAWLLMSGRVIQLFVAPLAKTAPHFASMAIIPLVLGGLFVPVFAGCFAYLTWRPKWWGALLAIVPGIAWLLLSAVFAALGPELGPVRTNSLLISLPRIAGAAVLAVAAFHMIVELVFSRPGRDDP